MLTAWERLPVWIRALIAVLVLTGIGATIWFWPSRADDTAIELPASDPESTANSAEPGPTAPPSLPVEARANTPDGAKAFTRHFIEIAHYGELTGDSEALKPLFSHEECNQCLLIVEANRINNSDGKHVEGGEYTNIKISAGPIETGYVMWVRYSRTASTIIDRNGNKNFTPAIESDEAYIELRRTNNSWIVVSITSIGKT